MALPSFMLHPESGKCLDVTQEMALYVLRSLISGNFFATLVSHLAKIVNLYDRFACISWHCVHRRWLRTTRATE